MRRLAAAALLLIASFCVAQGADESCHFQSRGGRYVEWTDRGEYRGARIVSRSPSWELDDVFSYHGITWVTCATCSDEQLAGAMWFGLQDSSQRDLDRMIAPDSIARAMTRFPFRLYDAEFVPKSGAVRVSVGGLEGLAQVLGVRPHEGRASELITFATARDCLVLSGILFEKGGAPTSIDRLAPFSAAIAVESYKPDPPKFTPSPIPDELPLGDARKRLQEGQH
jgi:hypothetical protein